MRHRVEVLKHASDDQGEAWKSPTGRVELQKRGDRWFALLDGNMMVDADRLDGYNGTVGVEAVCMESHTVEELADLLALQEQLHLIFVGHADE